MNMFNNQKPDERSMRSEPGKTSPTIIARGVRVEGDFSSQGDVVIEGDVQGQLSASGSLMIGSESHIQADIRAGEAVIAGHIEGNLHIEKRLVLKATAHITGDVSAQTVSIEEGATVSGKFSIGLKPIQEEASLSHSKRQIHATAGPFTSVSKAVE